MGLESIFETVGKLFHHPDQSQPAEIVPSWQKRLLKMQEAGATPDEQLIVLTSSLFDPGVDNQQRQVMYEKIAGAFRALSRDNREELARAGDPNSIMSLMTEAGEEYKGNHEAQIAAQAYYLRLGMRPLRDKLLTLEEYARVLGIDPYATGEEPNNES